MKICILGATGNGGRRIVEAALTRGHQVTALVRGAPRIPIPAHEHLTIRPTSFDQPSELVAAMRGHDAVINAAGNISDGPKYVPLIANIITAAQNALEPGGRFWLFGGAAVLDVPGTSLMTLDLPLVPKIFEAHRTNLKAIGSTNLDWSMLCPGPMIDSPDGKPTTGLRISQDIWPMSRPTHTYVLPRAFLSLAFKRAMSTLTIYYEDAACVILDHLQRNGPLSRKRVGIALPHGQKRSKDYVPS